MYIGLMSGTSLDGIDAVLADFRGPTPQLLGSLHHAFPPNLGHQLKNFVATQKATLQDLGEAHTELGECYAKLVLALLQQIGIPAQQVQAIGNHGQTLCHHPKQPYPFTLQLGNHSVLAARTGIAVVADFRSLDMAYGGQGAPLAPLFHQAFLADPNKNTAVVNIGGIANATILYGKELITAFDTGPGNGLLDEWMQQHYNQAYDHNGERARQMPVDQALLNDLLQDPYFAKTPPKSTGREYFKLSKLPPTVNIATLTELTAQSILNALQPFAIDQISVCGGGAFNGFLLERLGARSIAERGFDPQMIEPLAFAWLAKMRCENQHFDLAKITGSDRPLRLGHIFSP